MNFDKTNLQFFTNPEEWNTLLQEVGNYDFYHTYDYHILKMRDNLFISIEKLIKKHMMN